MAKLTYSMRSDLARLAERDNSIHRRSITNPALNALKRRGLASVAVTRDPKYGCFTEFWDITDAGREALAGKA